MDGGASQQSRPPSYTAPFFAAYAFYYAGYCVFSSFIVLYLAQRGYSATICGLITSLALIANLLMEPVGGYMTDTFISTRSYLALCIALIVGLCLFCTYFAGQPILCMAALILTAGLAYPFSQLMDAWVNCSLEVDPNLVYSRIRAGGSIGFALSSIAAGYYFRRFGWDSYFLLQAGLFMAVLPLLFRLPRIELGNRGKTPQTQRLSLGACFGVAIRNRRYLLTLILCTVYYFGHRPVGSYLSFIVQARAGDSSTYGNVCGVGAVSEFFALLVLSYLQRIGRLPLWLCMAGALSTSVLRPLFFWLLLGIWPLYVGQVLQSISFALFYCGGVACFSQAADRRIRSFSISMGLTFSSVAGTVCANLVGGLFCDTWGVPALIQLSILVSTVNLVLLILWFSRLFPEASKLKF